MYGGAPNVIANAVLLAAIPAMFALVNSQPRARAVAVGVVFAALFFPEGVVFSLPVKPDLDKHKLVPLLLLIGLLVSRQPKDVAPKTNHLALCAGILFVGSIGSVLNNMYPIPIGAGMALPALNLTNVLTKFLEVTFYYIVPFQLGRIAFATPENIATLLRWIAIFGVLYTPFMITEMVAGPEMNVWVYGYHQHDPAQAMRDGGFRPMVFMAHGLAVSLFIATGIFSSVILGQIGQKILGLPAYLVAVYLGIVLSLCNSTGALIYGVLVPPLLLFASPRLISKLASWIGILIVSIPLLRAVEIIRIWDIIRFVEKFSPARAQSLAFRFSSEEMFLEKWTHQPWFGYGGNARGFVYDEFGRGLTIPDSTWILLISEYGLFGFAGFFFLLLGPVWFARKVIVQAQDKQFQILFSGMVMILLIITFELTINGLFTIFPLLFAGAVLGSCENFRQAQPNPSR